jgi:hypothetical protein
MLLLGDLIDAEPPRPFASLLRFETQFFVQRTRDLCLYGFSMPVSALLHLRWFDHEIPRQAVQLWWCRCFILVREAKMLRSVFCRRVP